MSEKTMNFGDKKIDKKDFYNNKKQFNIENTDINRHDIDMDITITLLVHYNYFYQK